MVELDGRVMSLVTMKHVIHKVCLSSKGLLMSHHGHRLIQGASASVCTCDLLMMLKAQRACMIL